MTADKLYPKESFLEDVRAEIILIKERATQKEIGKLDSGTFDPEFYTKCIYGQMTGDCRSIRAAELILQCCRRYVNMPDNRNIYTCFPASKGFGAIQPLINGERPPLVTNPESFMLTRPMRLFNQGIRYFSALETYIQLPDAKNENVINFLKGKTTDLQL